MYILLVLVYLILIFLDQFSKYFINIISNGEVAYTIPIIKNIFSFTYVENRGGVFGSFQGSISIFTIISTLLIAYVVYTEWHQFKKRKFSYQLGIVFIAAGASGNMIDRYFRGYVIDMIDFHAIWSYIFNFADVYIHIGIIILLVSYLIDYKGEK